MKQKRFQPSQDTSLIKYYQREKSLKTPFSLLKLKKLISLTYDQVNEIVKKIIQNLIFFPPNFKKIAVKRIQGGQFKPSTVITLILLVINFIILHHLIKLISF